MVDCIKSLAITPDNKYIITGAVDSGIRIFNLETKQPIMTLSKSQGGHKDAVMGLCVSNDCTAFVSASIDRSIIKWDLSSYKVLHFREETHNGINFLLTSSQ